MIMLIWRFCVIGDVIVCCYWMLTMNCPTHTGKRSFGMNQVLIAITFILFSVGRRASASTDTYAKACPAGSKCYGAKGSYSAFGYRGCIRTFDCNVQINMVFQENKNYGGFDYFYFVCLRVPNSTLTMFFTPDLNNTSGNGMIHAKVKVTKRGAMFKSFIRDGDREVKIDPTPETAKFMSGFHLSNKHLVQVEDFGDSLRALGDEDESVDHRYAAHTEALPILKCNHTLAFFSQEHLFYYPNDTASSTKAYVNLKYSKNLYLKIRLADSNGTEIENVTITLSEPDSGRAGVIFIVAIAAFIILVCTKCCNGCLCCRSCFKKDSADVEAQAENQHWE